MSTGGLFIVVGALEERTGTRDWRALGGLWKQLPRMGAAALVLGMASVALPGLGNFVAEFLVLAGTFRGHPAIATIATGALVISTLYALRLVQRVFHGPSQYKGSEFGDLSPREWGTLAVMVGALVWLGLAPQPFIETVESSNVQWLEAEDQRAEEVP